jgi:hypothetical protein
MLFFFFEKRWVMLLRAHRNVSITTLFSSKKAKMRSFIWFLWNCIGSRWKEQIKRLFPLFVISSLNWKNGTFNYDLLNGCGLWGVWPHFSKVKSWTSLFWWCMWFSSGGFYCLVDSIRDINYQKLKNQATWTTNIDWIK